MFLFLYFVFDAFVRIFSVNMEFIENQENEKKNKHQQLKSSLMMQTLYLIALKH